MLNLVGYLIKEPFIDVVSENTLMEILEKDKDTYFYRETAYIFENIDVCSIIYLLKDKTIGNKDFTIHNQEVKYKSPFMEQEETLKIMNGCFELEINDKKSQLFFLLINICKNIQFLNKKVFI